MSIFRRVRRVLGLETPEEPEKAEKETNSPRHDEITFDEGAYVAELEAERAAKDAFFRSHPASPIPPEERQHFASLEYYPPNPALRFVVRLERIEPPEPLSIPTSTGDEEHYERIGYVSFEVEGQPVRLAVYRSVANGSLFIPFRDATSGTETYGGGRYLEPIPLGDDKLLLDFNRAYNPYCAYSDEWSCPLPPPENWLKVPIRAGEKAYRKPAKSPQASQETP